MENLKRVEICKQACQRVIFELQKVEQPNLKDLILVKLKDAMEAFNFVLDDSLEYNMNQEIERIIKWAECEENNKFDAIDLICNFDYPDKISHKLLFQMKELGAIQKVDGLYSLTKNHHSKLNELKKYDQLQLFTQEVA